MGERKSLQDFIFHRKTNHTGKHILLVSSQVWLKRH